MAFLVYRASAGSGKTYTLVRTYLALALSGDDPAHFRHILAITFTNKAAQEMKSRIIAALAEISGQQPGDRFSSMAADLSTALELTPKALKYRAGRVFQAILHRYQDFSISTIDAFVAKIGRSFARDLRLQQGFEILLDQQQIKEQAVDLLLSRLGEDRALTKTLVAFALEQTADDKSWDIRKSLMAYCQELFKDESRVYLPLLAQLDENQLQESRKALQQRIANFEETIQAAGNVAFQIIQESGLDSSCFAGGQNGIYGFFKKCAQGDFEKITDTVRKNFDNDKWAGSKVSKSELAVVDGLVPALRIQLTKIIDTVDTYSAEYRLYKAIRKTLYATATLGQLHEAVGQVLDEQQATTLNELYHRIGLLLADAATPFIYERLGNRYQHFLIDEFQDTSLVQWQNLAPLVDNGLSTNHSSLLVGDAKQAIYRWRSGEAGQFVNLPEPYGQQPAYPSFYNAFELHNLGDNYRSGETIIQFNNRFFRFWAEQLPAHLQSYYAALEQNPKRPGGYVSVQLLEKEKEKGKKEINKRVELIISQIQDLLQRGFTPGDMAVLVRSNATGTVVASALLQANLPVVSADSLLLGSHTDVQFIVHLIRWLYKDDELAEAAIKYQLSLDGTLPNTPLYKLLLEIDTDWQKQHWLALPLYELAEQLLDFFGLNTLADPFISALLDQLHQFGQQPDATTDAWLNWWDEKGHKTAVTLPEGLHAIQVMTIHKAKGLEFPVVFLPETDPATSKLGVNSSWIPLPETLPLPIAYVNMSDLQAAPPEYAALYEEEQHKTQLDFINTIYVACTRASVALFIYAAQANTDSKASTKGFSTIFRLFKGESTATEESYTYGQLPDTYSSKNSGNDQPHSGKHPYNVWREQLRLSTKFRAADTLDDQPALRRGRLAHQLLAKLKQPAELPSLLAAAIEAGNLSREEAEELSNVLQAKLNETAVAVYFDPNGQLLNEAAIIGPATNLRPDRVLLVGNEARVLEYKTGQPDVKHQHQLDGYLEKLREMGYQASGRLLYIDQ